LATVQQAEPETAWLLLRRKEAYAVYLAKWMPQMQRSLVECIETLESTQAPEYLSAVSGAVFVDGLVSVMPPLNPSNISLCQ